MLPLKGVTKQKPPSPVQNQDPGLQLCTASPHLLLSHILHTSHWTAPICSCTGFWRSALHLCHLLSHSLLKLGYTSTVPLTVVTSTVKGSAYFTSYFPMLWLCAYHCCPPFTAIFQPNSAQCFPPSSRSPVFFIPLLLTHFNHS